MGEDNGDAGDAAVAALLTPTVIPAKRRRACPASPPTSLIPFPSFESFDPATVKGLIKAFDEACAVISEQPLSEAARVLLATKITDLAQLGVVDPVRLRDEAVAYFKSKQA